MHAVHFIKVILDGLLICGLLFIGVASAQAQLQQRQQLDQLRNGTSTLSFARMVNEPDLVFLLGEASEQSSQTPVPATDPVAS